MEKKNLLEDGDIKYYELEDGDKVLELWGASTKHPDKMFFFDNFEKSRFVDEDKQIFQWILECASKLTFPQHAYDLAKFAMEHFVNFPVF